MKVILLPVELKTDRDFNLRAEQRDLAAPQEDCNGEQCVDIMSSVVPEMHRYMALQPRQPIDSVKVETTT